MSNLSNYINNVTGPQNLATGSAIASATTVNLDAATGNRVHITGTTPITAITLTRGPRTLIFDGVLVLTHNATTNNLPGAANITTAVGDRAIYESDGTTVYCVSYIKASGTPVLGAGNNFVTVYTGNGQGSTNTAIRRFALILGSAGTAITYADSTTLGATFTINESGLYAMTLADQQGANTGNAISLNSAQLTTSPPGLAVASQLAVAVSGSALSISTVVRLVAGDVIRVHVNTLSLGTSTENRFNITKVGV